MQLFSCNHCGQPVYFENTVCQSCGSALGFDPLEMTMHSLQRQGNSNSYVSTETGTSYHFCANHQYDVCNWIIPDKDDATFCIACALNRVIPNLSNQEYRTRWQKIETAKHRLIYALLQWNLPVISKTTDHENGLVFDFKADPPTQNEPRVLTGHANGIITMNIAEADDVEREMAKNNMDEVYRTILGHFRHEVGHYYWDLFLPSSQFLEEFRQIFGDERMDYQKALDKHYQEGAPANWQQQYISAYATMHPWEDWAETWAHYLHIVDTLETAYSFGISIHPRAVSENASMRASIENDAYDCSDFEKIFHDWLPVTFAMNSINRSMGESDLYPFVISDTVKKKLAFVHKIIHNAGGYLT